MAQTIRASFLGADELARDLEAVSFGLERVVGGAIAAAAAPIAGQARRNTPIGPGPRGPRDRLPHIASTIYAQPAGSGASIVSTHPAAPVFEHGGTIAPRGAPIRIRQVAMAHRAGEQQLAQLSRDATDRLDRLAAEHGLA